MARLFDYRLGAGVTVADERVEDLISSGNYSFIKGKEVVLVHPDGQLYNVPAEEAHLALQEGYRYAPTELVEHEDMKADVEDSPLTSTALGAARGLTFGASDLLLQGAGFTEEEIKMHRDLNPIATTLGEVGSLITPFGVTSALGRAAAKGGALAAHYLGKKAALKAGGLAERVLTGATGGAAEGAVVGGMYATSSQILDDPEKRPLLADHIYAGAGFGGVAGGLVGAVSKVLSSGKSAFTKETNKAYFRALGGLKPDWNKVTQKGKYPDAVYELGRRIKEFDKKGVLQNLGEDADDLVKELDNVLLPEYGSKLDDIITRVEGAAKKAGVPLNDIRFDPESIAERMTREIIDNPQALGKGMVDEPQILAKIGRAEASIEAFRDIAYKNTNPFWKHFKAGRQLSFRESEELKTWYQKNLANYKRNPEDYDYFNAMASIIREESENALDAIAGRLSQVTTLPKNTYAEFIEAKAIYASLKQIRDIASGAAAREAVNNRLPLTSFIIGGGLGGGAMAAADSLVTGGLIGAATFAGTAMARKYLRDSGELLLARTMSRITDYGEMLNMAGKSEKMIRGAVNSLTRVGDAAAVKFVAPTPPSPEVTLKQFEKVRDDLNNFAGNPQTLFARMERMVPEVDGDQSINLELIQTMTNGINFLQERLPVSPIAGQTLLYNNQNSMPSMPSIMRFMRYVETINDPNSILMHVAGGSLTKEHMEAITMVFPRLYQDQKKYLLQEFAGKQPKLDGPRRASLSKFFQEALDPSLKQNFIQSTQQYYKDQNAPIGQRPSRAAMDVPGLETQSQAALQV